MAAKGMEFPWRWTSGTISPNLDVIWGMSVQMAMLVRFSMSSIVEILVDIFIVIPIALLLVYGIFHPTIYYTKRIFGALTDLLRQKRLRQRAHQDRRPFYLLLHSFTETSLFDSTLATSVVEVEAGEVFYTSMVELIEEALGKAAKPVITVGSYFPKGKHAIRVNVEGNSWQHICRTLLPVCRGIILIPEITPSLMEEIGWLCKMDWWRKTIVVMPCFAEWNQKRWDLIIDQYHSRGMFLPPYQPNGVLYLPNPDLSPRESCIIYDREICDTSINKTYLIRRIQTLIDDLSAQISVSGLPLKDAILDIVRLERKITFQQVFRKQIDRSVLW